MFRLGLKTARRVVWMADEKSDGHTRHSKKGPSCMYSPSERMKASGSVHSKALFKLNMQVFPGELGAV